MAKHIHDNKDKVKEADYKFACQLTDEAVKDVKSSLQDSYKLMEAFIRYARGTNALIKQAKKEAGLRKRSQFAENLKDIYEPDADAGEGAGIIPMEGEGIDVDLNLPEGGSAYTPPTPPSQTFKTHVPAAGKQKVVPDYIPDSPFEESWDFQAPPKAGDGGPLMADDNMVDDNADKDNDSKKPADKPTPDPKPKEKAASIEVTDDRGTKEGRAALREKLAQKGLQFSDMLNKAHPGGGETTDLDVKPTGDLAKVERLDETNKAMMDVALAPPRVRQAAEEIQMLVIKGHLNPTDEMFDSLIAEGLD